MLVNYGNLAVGKGGVEEEEGGQQLNATAVPKHENW